MADVFVSYKKEDFTLAEQVVAAIKADGFSVWWDNSLTPRSAWDAMIEQEIAAAMAVVVLWTPLSTTSDWVRTEAHYALDRGKLVPVMMQNCTIPIAFILRQTINLTTWHGDRTDRDWRRLLTWIADLVSTKPGNANIPKALGAARANPFREVVGHLPNGEVIVDGALVNASTPVATLFRDGTDMPAMRIIPTGSFLLGSPATEPGHTSFEEPRKRVEISAALAIGAFPITVGEYAAVLGPSNIPKGLATNDPALPVVGVPYDDAQRFLQALSQMSAEEYRLPSETEWEYACRAGSRMAYSSGATMTMDMAAFALSDGPVTVGQFPRNGFGLWDMHGNVREWTDDLWHESYDETPADGTPALQGHGSMRVVRGGAWCDDVLLLRSAARMRATQSSRTPIIGFRVVRLLR